MTIKKCVDALETPNITYCDDSGVYADYSSWTGTSSSEADTCKQPGELCTWCWRIIKLKELHIEVGVRSHPKQTLLEAKTTWSGRLRYGIFGAHLTLIVAFTLAPMKQTPTQRQPKWDGDRYSENWTQGQNIIKKSSSSAAMSDRQAEIRAGSAGIWRLK